MVLKFTSDAEDKLNDVRVNVKEIVSYELDFLTYVVFLNS